MVLKSQYWHAKGRLELFKRTKPAYVLPLTWRPDFGKRKRPTMDFIWTIWLKDYANDTKYIPLEKK